MRALVEAGVVADGEHRVAAGDPLGEQVEHEVGGVVVEARRWVRRRG